MLRLFRRVSHDSKEITYIQNILGKCSRAVQGHFSCDVHKKKCPISHCGGKEGVAAAVRKVSLRDPPQAESPAEQDSILGFTPYYKKRILGKRMQYYRQKME